jgi:hypothetical protein
MAREIIGDWNGALTASRRTRPSGKQRVTLEVRAESISVETNPGEASKILAGALVEAIRKRIQQINVTASPETVLKRKYARSAIQRGAAWATRRYAGGRIGRMDPDSVPGDRLFNDSGRFARSLVARLVTSASGIAEYTINVAANRLDQPQAEAMLQRLIQLVPEIGDPKRLRDTPELRDALDQTLRQMIRKRDSRGRELKQRLASQVLALVRQVLT